MTAYWNDPKGYGDNRISRDAMQKLVSLEVYAARSWAALIGTRATSCGP